MQKGCDIIDPLSVDCVVFGFENSELSVLLIQHADGISAGSWGLPGGWIQYNESIDFSAHRVLKDLTGLEDIFLEQLRAFGEVDRYPVNRVITIAFVALIRTGNYIPTPGSNAASASWYPITDTPNLMYDHEHILAEAHQHLKIRVKNEPIGFNLLDEQFTLLDLQHLYESILQVKLDKSNFRRKIMKMNLLKPSSEKQTGVNHRAARLYRFDPDRYHELCKKGFVFEI